MLSFTHIRRPSLRRQPIHCNLQNRSDLALGQPLVQCLHRQPVGQRRHTPRHQHHGRVAEHPLAYPLIDREGEQPQRLVAVLAYARQDLRLLEGAPADGR
jgi:hypothetical protein